MKIITSVCCELEFYSHDINFMLGKTEYPCHVRARARFQMVNQLLCDVRATRFIRFVFRPVCVEAISGIVLLM